MKDIGTQPTFGRQGVFREDRQWLYNKIVFSVNAALVSQPTWCHPSSLDPSFIFKVRRKTCTNIWTCHLPLAHRLLMICPWQPSLCSFLPHSATGTPSCAICMFQNAWGFSTCDPTPPLLTAWLVCSLTFKSLVCVFSYLFNELVHRVSHSPIRATLALPLNTPSGFPSRLTLCSGLTCLSSVYSH